MAEKITIRWGADAGSGYTAAAVSFSSSLVSSELRSQVQGSGWV